MECCVWRLVYLFEFYRDHVFFMLYDFANRPSYYGVMLSGESSPYAEEVSFFYWCDWVEDEVPKFTYILGLVSSAGEEGLEGGGDERYFVLGMSFHLVVVF